jgi:hypothetical protein
MLNLKELHFTRRQPQPKLKLYSFDLLSLHIFEMPNLSRGSWNPRQDEFLKYIIEEKHLFQSKNTLVLFDGPGIFCILLSIFGASVSVVEDSEYDSLIEKNIQMNLGSTLYPKFGINTKCKYDYVIVSECIYASNDFATKVLSLLDQHCTKDTKIFLTIRNDLIDNLISNKYLQRQITKYNSNFNVAFELQQNILSWLLESRLPSQL